MPNLVFIMSDEARKDVVFHEKYSFVRTPHIDALRAEAVSFHHCFANYPVCVPSRASVITGRYPQQLGVLSNRHRLPAAERDLGHHLAGHGFDCVAFGKTHGVNRGFRSVTYDTAAAMGFGNHGYLEDPELITGVFDRPAEEYCDFVACRQFDHYLRHSARGAPRSRPSSASTRPIRRSTRRARTPAATAPPKSSCRRRRARRTTPPGRQSRRGPAGAGTRIPRRCGGR